MLAPAATPPGAALAAAPAPVPPGRRIGALDELRGVALLGILAMNVYAFAMPFAAYSDPLRYGGDHALDLATWAVTHLLFELKFMMIFSLLFGAGLALADRRAAGRAGWREVWLRRQGWLMVLGALHGYLLWQGDILFHYGLCGLLIFPLRRLPPRRLLGLGTAALLVAPLLSAALGAFVAEVRSEAAAATAEEVGAEASPAQQEALAAWAELAPLVDPDPAALAEDVAIHRGGYGEIFRERLPVVFSMQTDMTLVFVLWRAGGLMLIGVALLRLGVLDGARDARFYRRLMLWGYGLGTPLVLLGMADAWVHRFEPVRVLILSGNGNYFGSLGVGLGHVGAVLLVHRAGWLPRLRARLAAVGRTALSNYLLQSLLATTIFYGYGFGLYGHLGRFAQMGVVFAVWGLQLALAPWWLRRFRFGPAEWLWRSLAYRRVQPLRRSAKPQSR